MIVGLQKAEGLTDFSSSENTADLLACLESVVQSSLQSTRLISLFFNLFFAGMNLNSAVLKNLCLTGECISVAVKSTVFRIGHVW